MSSIAVARKLKLKRQRPCNVRTSGRDGGRTPRVQTRLSSFRQGLMFKRRTLKTRAQKAHEGQRSKGHKCTSGALAKGKAYVCVSRRGHQRPCCLLCVKWLRCKCSIIDHNRRHKKVVLSSWPPILGSPSFNVENADHLWLRNK
jgi:hypothetical protein